MSIPSLYASGDDEEELFRLTAPDDHPDAADDGIAKLEEQFLASSRYDDEQDESDEATELSARAATLRELSDDELAEVDQFIQDILNRCEQEG